MVLVLACGIAVGLVLGLLGAGGSILTVPILTLVADVDPRAAVVSSLVVVGATSLFAAIQHARQRPLALEVALLFSVTSVPVAFVGAQASRGLSPRALTLAFSALMAGSALAMLFRRDRGAGRARSRRAILMAGAGVGLITGVLGAGGGFMIVPALVLFGGLTMRDAVPSSLVAIVLNCAAGLMGKWGSATVPWGLTLSFTAVALAGSALGLRLGRGLSPVGLKRLFAVLVLGIALAMALGA